MNVQQIKSPPVLGDRVLFAYLDEMSRQLNYALQQIPDEAYVQAQAKTISKAESGAQAEQQAITLKSLIMKSADEVNSAIDLLRTELRSSYVAQSEFGSYKADVTNQIEQSAEGTLQRFETSATVTNLKDDSAAFESYMNNTLGYIKSGILYYDDDDNPILGVAVSDEIKEKIVDGKKVIDTGKFVAMFTSQRLSFWNNDVEVAYFSNNSMVIHAAEIIDTLKIGRWQFDVLNGLTLKKL